MSQIKIAEGRNKKAPKIYGSDFGGKDIIITIDGTEVGAVQALNFEYNVDTNKTKGVFLGMTFYQMEDEDKNLLKEKFNVVITGANEYGGVSCLAITGVRVTKWNASISVDNTRVDEKVEFEADGPPTPWTRCELVDARTETK